MRPFGQRFASSLSLDATALHERILRGCCAYIIEIIAILPGFEVGVFGELLARQSEIMRHVDQRFDRLPMQLGGTGAETFKPRYRKLVAKQLDKVELFGVTVSDHVGNYPLNVAYVSLSIRSSVWIDFAAAEPERLDSGVLSIEEALFIRLRRYSGSELPAPDQFLREVGRNIAHSMPLDWMEEVLSSGRALVLVDGVDELPDSQRRHAEEWLRELVVAYPRARYMCPT